MKNQGQVMNLSEFDIKKAWLERQTLSARHGLPWACLISIIGATIIIQILHLTFFNDILSDDGYFIQYAFNVARGQLGFGVLGTLFGTHKYVFAYPFGYPFVMSKVVGLLGPGPVTVKLLPLFFYLSTIGVIVVFGRRALGPWGTLVAAGLLAVDPAFAAIMNQVRPQAALALCFALGGTAYLYGVETSRARWVFSSGFATGLGFLIGLSPLWLALAILVHQFLFRGVTRYWREKFCFFSSLALVIIPYGGWVLLSPERRSLFTAQIFPWTINSTSVTLWEIGKRLLNPVADLYLLVFRHYSPYPIFLVVVFFVLGTRWRRYCPLLLMILTPLFMVMLNLRAGHYLVPTMPLGYFGFGYVMSEADQLPSDATSQSPSWRLITLVTSVVVVAMVVNGFQALRPPTLRVDVDYYRNVLETHTEPGSVIATDLGLVLSATEDRVLISTSPFIWQAFRRHFTYEEIVKTLHPDYIVLTERKKPYAFSPDSQTRAFKEYLAKAFELQNLLYHPLNGRLWVYRRVRNISQHGTANDSYLNYLTWVKNNKACVSY